MRAALFVSLLLLASVPASAQHASPVARELRVAQQSSARSGAASFGIEALGGAIGSGIGFGAVYLLANDCESEDLSCTLETAFLALLTATGGAAAGTLLAGDAFDTDPSTAGAILGAIAGAAAGVGVWHLLTEEWHVVNRPAPAILTYSLTQGVVTALGSRLGHALR